MEQKDQLAFDQGFAESKHVVLLAEDEPIVRNFLLLMLQRWAYGVLVAIDGQEAIELSRSYGIDMIPDSNGNQILIKYNAGVGVTKIDSLDALLRTPISIATNAITTWTPDSQAGASGTGNASVGASERILWATSDNRLARDLAGKLGSFDR